MHLHLLNKKKLNKVIQTPLFVQLQGLKPSPSRNIYNHEPLNDSGENASSLHTADTVTSCRKEFVINWIGKGEPNFNFLIETFLLKTGILNKNLQVVVAVITKSDLENTSTVFSEGPNPAVSIRYALLEYLPDEAAYRIW